MQIHLPKKKPRNRVQKKKLALRLEAIIACVLALAVGVIAFTIPPANLIIIFLQITLTSALVYYVCVLLTRIRWAALAGMVVFFALSLLALQSFTLIHVLLLAGLAVTLVVFFSQ